MTKVNHCKYCGFILEITNTLRKLWEQHIMWTRSFIISTAENLGDVELVTERLLGNPGDFARFLRRFYSRQKIERFERLFTEHLTIAAQLVNEAKVGNTAAVDRLREEWFENGKKISALLSSINPFQSTAQWQKIFFRHLKMTEDEAVFRLTGQYARDIAIYDQIEADALTMADMMAEGIIRQLHKSEKVCFISGI